MERIFFFIVLFVTTAITTTLSVTGVTDIQAQEEQQEQHCITKAEKSANLEQFSYDLIEDTQNKDGKLTAWLPKDWGVPVCEDHQNGTETVGAAIILFSTK